MLYSEGGGGFNPRIMPAEMRSAFSRGRPLHVPWHSPTRRPSLRRIVLGQQIRQPIQLPFQLCPMSPHPLLQRIQPRRRNPAGAHPAHFLRMRQPALLQDLQMLHHRRQRNTQRPREIRYRPGTLAQPIQHRPPRRIPQRVKQAIDIDPAGIDPAAIDFGGRHSASRILRRRSIKPFQPSSNLFAICMLSPSKYAPWCVQIRSVPFCDATSSNVICEARMRLPPNFMVVAITMRSLGTISWNRASLSMTIPATGVPSFIRYTRRCVPPSAKFRLNSSRSCLSPSANHWLTFSGFDSAANTVSTGLGKLRSTTNVLCTTLGSAMFRSSLAIGHY